MSTQYKFPVPQAGAEASPRTIVMASDQELMSIPVHCRLALATKEKGLSRRKFPDAIADAMYSFEGTIYYADGRIFEPTDTEVDDVFDDPEFRWISDFVEFASVPPSDRRQRPQRRTLDRLRLIFLYFQIKHPERAKLIAK